MRRPPLPASKMLPSQYATSTKELGLAHPGADRATHFTVHVYWVQDLCPIIRLSVLFLAPASLEASPASPRTNHTT